MTPVRFRHALALIAALLMGCRSNSSHLTPAERAEWVIQQLSGAKTIEVLALDICNEPKASDETCCGFRIVGRTIVATTERRATLLQALRTGLDESRADGFPIATALPDFSEGIRATNGDGTVFEIAFNFESHRSIVVFNDGVRCDFPMGRSASAALWSILSETGVYPLKRDEPHGRSLIDG